MPHLFELGRNKVGTYTGSHDTELKLLFVMFESRPLLAAALFLGYSYSATISYSLSLLNAY